MSNAITRFLATFFGRKTTPRPTTERQLPVSPIRHPVAIETTAPAAPLPEQLRSGIALLTETLAKRDIIVTPSRREDLVLALQRDEIDGSKSMAAFLQLLLTGRAHKMSTALQIAEKLTRCPELIDVVQAILSSPAVVTGVPDPMFPPEIYGDGKVGWSGSYQAIHDIAREALRGWNVQPRLDIDKIAKESLRSESTTEINQILISSPEQQELIDIIKRFTEGKEPGHYVITIKAAKMGESALSAIRSVLESDLHGELGRSAMIALTAVKSREVISIVTFAFSSKYQAIRSYGIRILNQLIIDGLATKREIGDLAANLLKIEQDSDLRKSLQHLVSLA